MLEEKTANRLVVLVAIALVLAVEGPRWISATAEAQPAPSVVTGWRCFVSDRLPDVNSAMSWHGAASIAEGLNIMARHVAAGTVVATNYSPGLGNYSTPLLCVKY